MEPRAAMADPRAAGVDAALRVATGGSLEVGKMIARANVRKDLATNRFVPL